MSPHALHPSQIFSSHRHRKRHYASNLYRRAPRLRFQDRAVARRVSSRSMWRNFRRRSHTRAISQKLSRCVPRNRSLHLLGLRPTQCMQIFSRLGHQPRGSKGRKRQSPPIRPDLFRRRRRPPRIRQLMARSNKIDADQAVPHQPPSVAWPRAPGLITLACRRSWRARGVTIGPAFFLS